MADHVMERRGKNYPFDPEAVELDGNYEDSFLVSGRLKDFENVTFQAQVFDIGSEFGIADGRISKLQVVVDGQRDVPIIEYSRGWPETHEGVSLEPQNGREKLILDTIVEAFPEPDNHLELKGGSGSPAPPETEETWLDELEQDRLALEGEHEPTQPEPSDLGLSESEVSHGPDEPEDSSPEPTL
ncbi:MAG: hypothetical protein AAFQ66_08755 [Pseudomonadota bacterium]